MAQLCSRCAQEAIAKVDDMGTIRWMCPMHLNWYALMVYETIPAYLDVKLVRKVV